MNQVRFFTLASFEIFRTDIKCKYTYLKEGVKSDVGLGESRLLCTQILEQQRQVSLKQFPRLIQLLIILSGMRDDFLNILMIEVGLVAHVARSEEGPVPRFALSSRIMILVCRPAAIVIIRCVGLVKRFHHWI